MRVGGGGVAKEEDGVVEERVGGKGEQIAQETGAGSLEILISSGTPCECISSSPVTLCVCAAFASLLQQRISQTPDSVFCRCISRNSTRNSEFHMLLILCFFFVVVVFHVIRHCFPLNFHLR